MRLPVRSDARQLAERLAAEERDLVERLATLEARVRRFADEERPAYESWRRLEFGPLLATLQELSDRLRMRRILAHRVQDLVERDGLHPREALYMAENPEAWPAHAPGGGFDPDEVEARRRAKRDRKRAERREAKRAQRIAGRSGGAAAPSRDPTSRSPAPGARIVDLYRALARRIHPDSPSALRTLAPDRLGALWCDVQDAYESGSLERLLALAAWVDRVDAAERAPAPGADGVAATSRAGDACRVDLPGALLSFTERYDRLRALRRSLHALERQLATLGDDPAWDFAVRRRDDPRGLARRTRDAIDADAERVRAGLAEIDELLRGVGPPRPPRFVRRR